MATEAPVSTGRRPSRRFIAGKALREFFADDCWDAAAAMTFFAVLSLPPIGVAVTSVLALMGQGESSTSAVLEILGRLAPDDEALDTVTAPVLAVLEQPAAGTRFVLGLLTGLWLAAGYVGAFGRALNRIYGVQEGRPMWKLQAWHLLTTLVLVVFSGLVALLLVVSGPVSRAVGDVLGLRDVTVLAWEVLRWPVLVVAAVLMVAVLYYAAPNVAHPRFRWISPGSVVALGLAAIATVGLRLYISLFGRFDITYGAALAGLVVFFIWLWVINMALLLGAEVDTEVDRARQLVTGLHAYRAVQVSVRDSRASDRSAARRRADEERARSLRASHGWTDHETDHETDGAE